MFTANRRGLVEKSSLIKHTASRSKRSDDAQPMQANDQRSANAADSQSFLKDVKPQKILTLNESKVMFTLFQVVNQVLEGEGIGWLKLNRVRKLMEDENYRNLVVSRLNKTLEQKIGPDEHIDDLCVGRPVWRGMLKLLQAVTAGLEQTYCNHGLGGMASSFQLLEIAHTHYWTKEISDGKSDLGPPTGPSTAQPSQRASPTGSRENLRSPHSPRPSLPLAAGESDRSYSDSPESGTPVSVRVSSIPQPDMAAEANPDILRELLERKRSLMMLSLQSVESQASGNTAPDSCNASESGSIITNPTFQRHKLSHQSFRSAMSDGEVDPQQVNHKLCR